MYTPSSIANSQNPDTIVSATFLIEINEYVLFYTRIGWSSSLVARHRFENDIETLDSRAINVHLAIVFSLDFSSEKS